MQVRITEKTVEHNFKHESTFKIKPCVKAFQILSSGLYSDKITAIIREISCNAWDSHSKSNKLDTPFKVHLPNVIEPFFSVRDYGTGISKEDVYTVYTTYFESTKDDSNSEIGCLGLGSKSPFSYVDNFSVTSYHGGWKRIYNAFISSFGEPTISMIVEERSDEPTGLEVQFSVKKPDFFSFMNNSKQVFKYFKEKPIVVGNPEYEHLNPQYVLKGEGWGFRKAEGRTTCNAVMGNIAYPIEHMPNTEILGTLASFLSCNMDIEFKIGELDIAASREKLSFDPITINNIHKRLEMIKDQVSNGILAKVSNCKNLWEARCLYHELHSKSWKLLEAIQLKKMEWNQNDLSDVFVDCDIEGVSIMSFHSVEKWSRKRNSYMCFTKESAKGIRAMNETNLWVCDDNKRIYLRIKNYMEKNSISHMVMVKFADAVAEQKFIELYGVEGMEFPLISSLPHPPKKERVKGDNTINPKNKFKILKFNTLMDSEIASEYWSEEVVDIQKGGFYVAINWYKVNGNSPDCLNSYIKTLDAISASPASIYGVKASMVETIAAMPQWIEFTKYYREVVDKYIQENKQCIIDRAVAKSIQCNVIDNDYKEIYDVVSKWEDKPEVIVNWFDSVKFYKELVTNKELEKIVAPVPYAHERMQNEVNDEYRVKSTELNEKWEKMKSRYEIMNIVLNGRYCGQETKRNSIRRALLLEEKFGHLI